jgi:uncharacterized protein
MPQNTVTVTGTGSASGIPDELHLRLEVSTQADSVASALEAANAAMSRVQAALRDHGVADLHTDGLSVYPRHGDDGAITGHQVTESLAALLRDLGRAGAIIAAACDAGGDAVRVNDLSLGFADDSELLAAARTAAMADARLRAGQYAAAASRPLGAVLAISESDAGAAPFPLRKAMAYVSGASSPVPIAAGSQQVSATVTVTYALD